MKTYIMNIYGYELRCPIRANSEEEAFKEFERLMEIKEVEEWNNINIKYNGYLTLLKN